MTYLALYSFIKEKRPDIEFCYHSIEIDFACNNILSFETIYDMYLPNVVMCTSISCNFNAATNILKYFKSRESITVIGGLFATANNDWVLNKYDFIDYVVNGEGENTIVELLDAISNRLLLFDIEGVSFRFNNSVCTNKSRQLITDINTLPTLNYDNLPIQIYQNNNTRYYVFAGRGCCYDCDFCTLATHWQNSHRACSIDKVITEIEQLVTLFQPTQISFGDDTLALDGSYFRNLCKRLAAEQLPVTFGGKTRIDIITIEYLKIMYDAGFREISFGVESNHSEQLALLNKKLQNNSIQHINKILDAAQKLGIRVNLNFILGTPGETINTLKDKTDFIVKHCSSPNIIPLLSFITPHWGSNLFHYISKLGIKIVDNDLDHYNHLFPVCFPETLGENGILILKQTYNDISVGTYSESYNPLFKL
jgi:radical SAM superfamily enzyme YgiQ (UPF0313 family)